MKSGRCGFNAPILDKEIQGKQEEAEDEQARSGGATALMRKAADRVQKTRGDDTEAGFGAGQVKWPDGFKARKITPKGGDLVFHPKRDFRAMAPEISAAQEEKTVTETGQQTQRRTSSPIKHGTSP